MLGNSVNLLVQGGSQKNLGAAMVLVLMTILAIGMLYYLWETSRRWRGQAGMSAGATVAPRTEPSAAPAIRPSRLPDWLANPWGRPRFLAATTWVYIVWALVPGPRRDRSSRSTTGARAASGRASRPAGGGATRHLSVFHDPTYTNALVHSLELAALDMLIATPLGFLLAIGLSRWRGRGSRARQLPDAGAADDAGAGDGRLAAARLHPARDPPVQRRPPRDRPRR